MPYALTSRDAIPQAGILQRWGQLSEAMEIHQKEEKIKEELKDLVGLARCWWNLGILHSKLGDRQKHIKLWQKSIETKKNIGSIKKKYSSAVTQEILEKIDYDNDSVLNPARWKN